jgi:spore germination protein PF
MPSIVLSPIKITSVSGNSSVIFGDVLQITPKSASKTYSGGGGANTGDFLQTNTGVSFTNTRDPDIADTTAQSVN